MYCPKCGQQNDDKDLKCIKCGQLFKQVQIDDALGGLIPYKNVPALIAYYLGVFSAIPFVGIFLGLAAFILGIIGLKTAKKRPEVKGKIHAWVGILVGGFFCLLYIFLIVLIINAGPKK